MTITLKKKKKIIDNNKLVIIMETYMFIIVVAFYCNYATWHSLNFFRQNEMWNI